MRKNFYKHTYTVVVLSEDKEECGLDYLASSVNTGPDCLFSYGITKTEKLSKKQAADALYEAGSDPAFFGISS
jgi:hypothetical protein